MGHTFSLNLPRISFYLANVASDNDNSLLFTELEQHLEGVRTSLLLHTHVSIHSYSSLQCTTEVKALHSFVQLK